MGATTRSEGLWPREPLSSCRYVFNADKASFSLRAKLGLGGADADTKHTCCSSYPGETRAQAPRLRY